MSELSSDLSILVAEPHELSADLEMRIKTTEMQLAGLDVQVDSPWNRINDLLNRYGDHVIRLLKKGDTAQGVLLGSPDIMVLHNVNDEVSRCSMAEDCAACLEGTEGRVFVSWNFYDILDQRLKILVGDEILALSLQQSILHTEPFGDRIVKITNIGQRENDYRDRYYAVEFAGGVDTNPPSFWETIRSLELFSLLDLDVEKLMAPWL